MLNAAESRGAAPSWKRGFVDWLGRRGSRYIGSLRVSSSADRTRYSIEVLDAAEAARRAGAEKVETVDLPEAYLKAAGALAQERAAFAAHRLAGLLREDLAGQ